MPANPELQAAALAKLTSANLRRNFAALGADYGLFGLGMTFASASTILPAFAQHLGASNLMIGAIPAVVTLGYSLPPLFCANYTERLSRKLRFILTHTVWERLPLLMLAIAAYLLAETQPGLVLVVLLLSLAAISGVGGALTPAWMDLIGKVIPTNLRGRLFASGNTLGALLGLGGASLAGHFLETYPFPVDYALCFASGFLFLALSFAFLALVVEPEVPSGKPRVALATYLRRLPDILSRDRHFAWFLASRAVGIVGGAGTGFYAVYALRVLGAPEWEVARFTLILLAGQTAANLLFGYVADHLGHKPVLLAGGGAVIVGNSAALLSTRVEEVYAVFLCTAIATAAGAVSGLNLTMEFAPPADRPTYIGLSSTLTAPVALLAPLAGGLLADHVGYRIVFAVAGLASALGVCILATRVRDPRSSSRGTRSGAPA